MRLRILFLLLLLTACMPSTQEPTEIPATAISPSPIHTASAIIVEARENPFGLTATQLVMLGTQAFVDANATATAIASLNTATPRPQDLLYFPTANGLELTITSVAIAEQATQTFAAIWHTTPSPLPPECARITDSYQELRLEVFIRAFDIGKPEHSIKSISINRCPADDWSLPYEYQIVIMPQQLSEDVVIITAIEDIIRRLPNYPPENPDADNPVNVQIQRYDNSTVFIGRFKYQDGIRAYEVGLRQENLLQALKIGLTFQ